MSALYYDWRTHAEGPASYATFMRFLMADVHDPARLAAIAQPLYEVLPSLTVAPVHLSEIGFTFARRVLNFFQADIRERKLAVNLDEAKAALRI